MAVYSPESLGIKPPAGGFKTGGFYRSREYWGGTLSEPGEIHPQSDRPGAGGKAYVAPKDVAYIESQRKIKARPTTEDQITPYLNKFQGDIFKAAEAPKVKVSTMGEIEEAVTPTTELPPLVDWTERLETRREELGVAGIETSLNELKAEMREVEATMRERTQAQRGKGVALGVVAGRIGEIERQEMEKLDFLSRQGQRLTDELNTKYNVINQFMQTERLTYTDAVNRFDTEFTRNLKMYEIVTGQEIAALDQWNKDRAFAQSTLQVYTNAITKGNLTYADMSSDQKLMISKLEVQSGLPVGFISNLKMSVDDRLVSVNDKTGEALMIGKDGKFEVVQTGMRLTPTKPTEKETKKDDFAEMNRILQLLGGDDNIVSGSQWAEARSDWAQQGYNATEFDNAFRKYTNPDWDTYVGID